MTTQTHLPLTGVRPPAPVRCGLTPVLHGGFPGDDRAGLLRQVARIADEEARLAAQASEWTEGFAQARVAVLELEAAASDWQLLLQISDDERLGASWGEGFGRLWLLIRRQDLEASSFDQVWAIRR